MLGADSAVGLVGQPCVSAAGALDQQHIGDLAPGADSPSPSCGQLRGLSKQ